MYVAKNNNNNNDNLPKYLSQDLERIQRRALAIIFPLVPYVNALTRAGIRELKHATFLNHGLQPEVNISHARTVVSPRFSN